MVSAFLNSNFMQKNILEQRSRNGYVVPYAEIYQAGPSQPLAVSHFDGDHLQGDAQGADESDHVRGDIDPGGGGISVNILGTPFSISSPWE